MSKTQSKEETDSKNGQLNSQTQHRKLHTHTKARHKPRTKIS